MSSDESKGDLITHLLDSLDDSTVATNSVSCEDGFPACNEMFSKFFTCYGMTNQFNHVYKLNEFDSSCGHRFADWRKCLHAASVKHNNPAKAKEIYETSAMSKKGHYINDVLPMKKTPSWAIEEDKTWQEALVEHSEAPKTGGWDYFNISSYIWRK
jgi:hypothetical protein